MTAAFVGGDGARPVYVVETTTSSAMAGRGGYVVEKLVAQTLNPPSAPWLWNGVAAVLTQVIVTTSHGANIMRGVLSGVLRGDLRAVMRTPS